MATLALMAKSKDYTRVCNHCGATRLLPKELATAKGPSDRKVRSMNRASRFALGRQRTRYSTQAAALMAQQDRVLAAAQCPQCGSSDYTQIPPK